MSKTLTQLINIIFISFFLLPTHSIKLQKFKTLTGKHSIDSLKSRAPIQHAQGNNFLENASITINATTHHHREHHFSRNVTHREHHFSSFSRNETHSEHHSLPRNLTRKIKTDLKEAIDLMNIKKDVERQMFPKRMYNSTSSSIRDLFENDSQRNQRNLRGRTNNNKNNNQHEHLFEKLIKREIQNKEHKLINREERKINNTIHLIKDKIVDRETKRDALKSGEKTKIADKVVKKVGEHDIKKDAIVNIINKKVAKFDLEKEKIKGDIRRQKELFKDDALEKIINEKTGKVLAENHLIEEIIKKNNARIVGVPILEISIKQKASRSLMEADGHLRREIAGHLEKEIARDTLRKAKSAKVLLERRSHDTFGRVTQELKKQIAEDVIRGIEHEGILEKAKAAEVLERICGSELEEKYMALRVIRKITENLRGETTVENMKKIDAVKVLDDTSLLDNFVMSDELLVKLIDNQKSRKIAEEILFRANEIDIREKRETLEALEIAMGEMGRASREIKREIEGKEILEIAEDDEEKSCHKSPISRIVKADNLKKEHEIKKELEAREVLKGKRNLRR